MSNNEALSQLIKAKELGIKAPCIHLNRQQINDGIHELVRSKLTHVH